MTQPTAYTRQFSFSDFSTENPTDQQPGGELENEFNAIKQTIDGILTNLALIQNDDTSLGNETVGPDQLQSSLSIGLNAVEDWVAGLVSVANDGVWHEGALYRCLVGHTATVFATDLAADKWSLIVDMNSEIEDLVDAYLDSGASYGNITIDRFSGTGAQTAFTLSVDPGSENNTAVFVGGTYIQKNAYSVSGTTLTFSVAPTSGTNNVEVAIGTVQSIGTPADATITADKIDGDDAADIRDELGISTKWITGVYVETVADGDYNCLINVPVGFKITSVRTKCTSGTATATFKIGSTALGGTANAVSSSSQTQAHTTSNTVATGDTVKVTFSSNSACLGAHASFQIEEV